MKGAGQPRDLDFDPTEDAQAMSMFETGSGKEWLETRLADKLASYEGEVDVRNGSLSKHESWISVVVRANRISTQ